MFGYRNAVSLQILLETLKKKGGVINSRHKGILNKHLNACFLWTFEYRRKRQVDKATK